MQGVCSPQRMHGEEPFSRAAQCVARLDLCPCLRQDLQDVACGALVCGGQLSVSYLSHQCGDALGACAPPDDHSRVVVEQLPYCGRMRLLHAERYNGRWIPEFHRLSSRSLETVERTAPWGSAGRRSLPRPRGWVSHDLTKRPKWRLILPVFAVCAFDEGEPGLTSFFTYEGRCRNE